MFFLQCLHLSAVKFIHFILILSLQTHLTFGKEFTEAVEMKQVAQQEAERARFVVEKVCWALKGEIWCKMYLGYV